MSSGGGDKSSSEQGIIQAGETMYGRGKALPEEEQQYKTSFEIGNILRQLAMYQSGMGGQPQGYQTPEQLYQRQGPLAQQYYQQTMGGVQNPYAAYESQLQPALQLTQDTINRQAQQRGLIRSGIPIELRERVFERFYIF